MKAPPPGEFHKISPSILPITDEEFIASLTTPCDSFPEELVVHEPEIAAAAKKLSSKMSCGADQIPNRLLKEVCAITDDGDIIYPNVME